MDGTPLRSKCQFKKINSFVEIELVYNKLLVTYNITSNLYIAQLDKF